jgi:hypothetical protein
MKTWSLSLIFLLAVAPPVLAQDWAKAMFSETGHDFGIVARGAKVEYQFTIENLYEEDAHISACYSSCECTTPQIDKRSLKTWDKAVLTAIVNTRGYYGQRDVTITVKFDAPFPAEVQVPIHVYIRSDVVVQPEEVQFGTVKLGSTEKRQVHISYAGRTEPSTWKIVSVESANSAIQGQVVETARVGNKVSYDLVATLKGDAPAGYIKDNLFLITNDSNPRAAKVPVPVVAIVASPLTVQPNPLFLGVIGKNLPASKPLVVRSTATVPAPFRITRVHCDDPRFEVTPPTDAKPMHLLPVNFKGADTEGRFTAKLKLETDLPNVQPVEVLLQVQVTP